MACFHIWTDASVEGPLQVMFTPMTLTFDLLLALSITKFIFSNLTRMFVLVTVGLCLKVYGVLSKK